ncbi:MAG: hypothetical protein ACXVFO_04255 [Solirubrobacteraceae bacterium]
MPRIPQPVPLAETTGAVRRRETGRGSVLALQRSIGNQAVRQLLQRQPTRTEMLSKAAKDLNAATLVYEVAASGVEEKDIGYARRIETGKPGIKPGLNIVEDLGARGRTGFVAADGAYLGDTLPATTADLPRIAISIGKQAFNEGEGAVRATLRHELEHAMHDQLLILVQRDWRAALKKAGKALPKSEADAERQLFAFAAGDKVTSTHGKPSAAELALIRGATQGHLAETELLAHLAGFMAVFETTPPAGPKGILGSTMAPALEQLRGAAQRGWTGVDEKVKAEAKDRIVAYYKSLAPGKKQLLRDWLLFLHLHVTTPFPDGTSDDAKAAKYVRSPDVFGPHREFLEWMLRAIREVEFGALKLPAAANRTPVEVTRRPKAAKAVKVGAGTVNVFTDVSYKLGTTSKPHGFSLSYEGADASDVRWLQFIWREVVPEGGTGVTGTWHHQTSAYELTTQPGDPSQIGWNTDTATGYRGGEAASAFYELENSVNRDNRHVEMFDEPSSPYQSMIDDAFKAARSGGRVRGSAHLVQYLVKGMDVLFRSEIQVDYSYAHATDNPDAQPKLISAGKASAIDPVARARLHQQFSSLDYLP